MNTYKVRIEGGMCVDEANDPAVLPPEAEAIRMNPWRVWARWTVVLSEAALRDLVKARPHWAVRIVK